MSMRKPSKIFVLKKNTTLHRLICTIKLNCHKHGSPNISQKTGIDIVGFQFYLQLSRNAILACVFLISVESRISLLCAGSIIALLLACCRRFKKIYIICLFFEILIFPLLFLLPQVHWCTVSSIKWCIGSGEIKACEKSRQLRERKIVFFLKMLPLDCKGIFILKLLLYLQHFIP